MYANQRGCDGDRLYYDGCSAISLNGQYVCQGKQFALNEVEVLTAVLDLDDVYQYRNSMRSFQLQAAETKPYPRVKINFSLSNPGLNIRCSVPIEWKFHSAMEEIA